jgi:MFS family permease
MSGPVPPLPTRSRGLALTVLCAATLMIILDGTIVTVALPAIQRDLGFAPASLSWVMNAYLIPFGGLLLLAGRLGDLIGRKRIFLAGLALFTAASLACGLSASPVLLVGSRFVRPSITTSLRYSGNWTPRTGVLPRPGRPGSAWSARPARPDPRGGQRHGPPAI